MSPGEARLCVHGDSATRKFRQETLNYFLECLGKNVSCIIFLLFWDETKIKEVYGQQ